MLQAGQSGVWIPAEEKDIPLLKNIQTDSEAQSASFSVGTMVLSWT